MSPDKRGRRPARSGVRTAEESTVSTIQRESKPRPPLAPASVYVPLGRRRWWWYSYPCRTCGAYQVGRAKSLDPVTGIRRADCGHQVSVMIARTYGAVA